MVVCVVVVVGILFSKYYGSILTVRSLLLSCGDGQAVRRTPPAEFDVVERRSSIKNDFLFSSSDVISIISMPCSCVIHPRFVYSQSVISVCV